MAGCGKAGPPLPPLVRVPVAPTNLIVDRRGDVVDVTFTVPDSNTDRSKPANVARVDVYAITGAPSVTDDQLVKRGTKIASVDVKSPADPNDAATDDEPVADAEPAVGTGLDQGAAGHVSETLTASDRTPVDATNGGRGARAGRARWPGEPLLGPRAEPVSRTYAAVGVSSHGKRGPFSKRVVSPLIEPPRAPGAPTIAYTETAVTLSWPAVSTAAPAAVSTVLPSKPLGGAEATLGYNVYDVSGEEPLKLTKEPILGTTTVDARIEWGDTRCYVVRAAATVADVTVESPASPATCETLVDTFPPAAPKALRSVGGDGVISLIWDANAESDLAGYVVFRSAGDAPMAPVVAEPIHETSFTDTVPAGVQFTYAVKAVDQAGNASAFSERTTDVARE